MSTHPSPGPSHPHSQNFHQPTIHSSRQKTRLAVGIAAGAEDAKYQTKYKELKRKVKEIEADNDKLHWRVLQAKRSIQRMKLERAILYERLSSLPASPGDDRNAIPPLHSGPGLPPPPPSHPSQLGHPLRDVRDYPHAPDEHHLGDYPRPNANPRIPSEGRPPMIDTSIPPGAVPPSRSMSSSHPSRRESAGSIPPLPPFPLPPHLPPVQHLDVPRPHSHSSHSSHSHSSPHMHHHSSSHERTGRSHSSHSRDQLHTLTRSFSHSHAHPQQYSEPLPPMQHVLNSPPLSDAERARRHDLHELAGSPHDPHGHPRHQPSLIPVSPHHSADSRTNRPIHAHQRMGPGTYINRGDDYPERDLDRDRDWERERSRDHVQRGIEMGSAHMHSPPSSQRLRHRDYPEHHPTSRIRDEQGYYQEVSGPGMYPVVSRSGTPASVGDDRPSRPDSRAQQYYEQERPRSYRLRPVNPTSEELDFVHEDGRGPPAPPRDRGGISGGGAFAPPPEQNRSSLDSKKRSRNDGDGENDIVESSASSGGMQYSGGRLPDDRGSKRYHRDGHLGRASDRDEE